MAPNTTDPGHFGPLVIGEEAAKQEQKVVESGTLIFGPLVTDAPVEDVQVAGVIEPKNLAELKDAVEQTPEAADALLEAELMRKEGPRKGALRFFHEREMKREGGARQEILDKLDAALDRAG